MAVVSMMRFKGDTDELVAKMQEHLAPVSERLALKHGGLASIVARAPDGVLVVNLWENEEGRHAMAEEPEIREALRAAGFPPPDFDGFEVLVLSVSDRITEAATT
jgi:hypothetical protein